ncbi:phage regulatory CII family protein, partial [Enterococcus faecium]|uniref:phage regulatory CII family protein n=1 Tax=Enterococcus faecium TaxID=1352 RepID=UPI003F8C8DCE
FTGLLDCIRQGAYTHRNPLKTIAADMDMSQSDLSRKLSGNPDDPRRMSVDDLEKYLAATGDMTPIYFLIEKYLSDEEAKRKRAMAELARKMPEFMALFQAA